jgi:hypothetical protein
MTRNERHRRFDPLFQLSANLPRLKSRVRIPCPAFKFNKFAAIIGGFFHFLVFGCVQGAVYCGRNLSGCVC